MRFSDSFLDEIRDRVPISALIGTRVAWDKRKTNQARGDFWGCCPFHGENTPSFHCEDRKGRYHCFGCGASGDHFRFLTELDGLSFPEAVSRVADMAGVTMPARDPQAETRQRERATLHDVMELATQFFEAQLHEASGAKARAYLRDRGLSAATQREFRLGYAPDSRNALKQHLASKGVEASLIEACGMVVHGEGIAVSYDRFRDRIMFPIEDSRGRIIAFGGRAMSAEVSAKYLNSPETELFHKGNVLYNFARARKGQGQDGTLIVVEGYMDVIALAQAGMSNAIAPLGTALTENQLDLLWRATGEPILCFDGDQAGLRAAWRAADLALPNIGPGKTARFALLPEGQDPDDIVRESGASGLRALLDEARPLAELIWLRETGGHAFETPERRAELEKNLRIITAQIKDESVRYHYQQEMRNRVLDLFGGARQRNGFNKQNQARGGGGGFGKQSGRDNGRMTVSDSLTRSALVSRSGALPLRETALIVSLINHPALVDAFFDDVERIDLDHPDLRLLHMAVLDAEANNVEGSRAGFVAHIAEAGFGELFERAENLVRKARLWPSLNEADIADARDAFLQLLTLHRTASTLHKELKRAEEALGADPTEENYQHLLEVQTQFRDVQALDALIEGFGSSSGRTVGR